MGRRTLRISNALRALGHETTLWFSEDFPRLERAGRLAVLAFPVALAWRLARRSDDFDAVVVHEPSGFWYGMLRALLPRLPPMAAQCHNVESKVFRETLNAAARGLAAVPRGSRVRAPLFRFWQSDGSVKLADHVLCLSTLDRDYLVRLGVHPARISCFPNGLSPADYEERASPTQGTRVLFVGGWLDVKGRRLLPPLWSRVRERISGARLTLVGTGASIADVLADFQEADRTSLTVIPRITDENEMRAQYARHDAFLMPSISEGSPIALLEAMAAGLPAVAARTGGIPDLIEHERTGLVFQALDTRSGADELVRLLLDARLAQRLGDAARARARELTWDVVARHTVQALELMVARSHP